MSGKSLKVNAIMNALLQVMSVIFPLITFPYVSRILLPEGVGKVSFANSIISYFVMFAQLGMPTYGIRACAQVRDNRKELSKTAHELLIINTITSIVSYVVFVIVLLNTPRLLEEKELFLVMSISIMFNAIGMEWLYKSIEAYAYITIRSIAFKFVALVCMFVFVHTSEDYIIYGGISILAAVGSNVFNLLNVRKHIQLKPIGGYIFTPHIKAVLVFFAMSCATTVYIHLNSAMLGFMTSNAVVGYYDTSVKVRTVLMHVVTALGVVLLPRTSYYVKHGKTEQFRILTEKALNFVLLFASALTVYFIVFAKETIYFLAGKAFNASIIPMQIIMPTLLLVGITNITGTQVLVPLGQEKKVLSSVMVGAVVDAMINVMLIPRIGASGAAVGALAAEVAVLVVQYKVLPTGFKVLFKNLYYSDMLAALLCGSIASVWIKILDQQGFFVLIISSICYFGAYAMVLLLRKNPLMISVMRDILKAIRGKYKK